MLSGQRMGKRARKRRAAKLLFLKQVVGSKVVRQVQGGGVYEVQMVQSAEVKWAATQG